jgi:CheY-like chemotaxis protein/two-component sensor histidine kinase
MNAIIGFTALAAAHMDQPDLVKDYLTKIGTSSQHLLSLINDVLDMSRIESGVVKIEEKEVCIPDILHDLKTIIQGNIQAKQQDLYIDTQDVVHENVITDRLRLNQILLNIVSNAIKFTPVGGMVNIRVSEKPCSRRGFTIFEFRIRDNGIGMSEEFQTHVFDSFSRERSSTQSGIKGTGLGMAITKNIVDMMGGTISLTSKEGKGTEFVVTLNFKTLEKATVYGAIPELVGARALVVDDDVHTCMSVSKMLREIEMRVDWSTSGKEAVIRANEAFEENDAFKVYIIDWLMPDMNGIETVRRIRAVVGDETPIIILTAYDWADIEQEAKEAGVTAFVEKPIFMSELRRVLTKPMEIKEETSQQTERETRYSGKKLLLVEDNELNREIATALLEEIGIIVDSVEDGTDAVERMNEVEDDRYDLIFMDIQMPKMDGYMTTREIRTLKNNKKANIPIIAMTANAFEEDKKKAFKAGMNAHIAKPIDIKTILAVFDQVFGTS